MASNSTVNLGDPRDQILTALKATEAGLSSAEATARLATYGPNDTATQDSNPIRQVAIDLITNPLVLILLSAAGVSIWLGDRISGGLIIAIVTISTAINVMQTHRSHEAMKSLQSQIAPTATALRDGKWIEIDRAGVVPGDMIRVRAGDMVPADARLMTANDLHVRESALTGESLPSAKRPDTQSLASAGPSENTACIFFGTSVVSGEGQAVVVNTGRSTIFGDIAARISAKPPENEFQKGLRKFGVLILKTVFFLVIFVFLLGVVQKRNPLESLLFSVALAVGLTPEFLPMITTITLSRGAVRMSKLGVIVKNLSAIQNLGSMEILCSDKTGTLTSGNMVLDKSVDVMGVAATEPLRYAAINSALETGIASGLDEAILQAVPEKPTGIQKFGEAPFDFDRRRMSVVGEVEGKRILVCKGAPEGVIAACRSVRLKGQVVDLNAQEATNCTKTYESASKEGFRVLAVASREVPVQETYAASDERDLILEGFLMFADPPLPDALQTIKDLAAAGVTVKIISGDNQLVTRHVCEAVGLRVDRIVLGDEIEAMSDPALQFVAEECNIFARVSPAQKSRIILALKARSHVVGYMGDGINDAPSLHVADVGISVSGGADVAKESADVILLRSGLDVLREGIIQGRTASGNVMKYLLMGTSSNFGNMFSMAGAIVVLPFLPMLPTQILLNNFLYDLSQITIPTDNVDADFIDKPQKWDISLIRRFMIVIGPISSIYDFLTFWVLLKVMHAKAEEFHTGWFLESLATQVLVIFVIRTFGLPWQSKPSKLLVLTIAIVMVTAFVIPYSPVASMLGFVALPPIFFLFLLLATVTYLGVVELVKRQMFRELVAH